MTTLTKTALLAMRPCDRDARIALFGDKEEMSIKNAFDACVSIRDVLWVAGKLGFTEKIVEFALCCAQRAAIHDKSGTAQPCISATRAYVANPSDATLVELRSRRRDAAAYAYSYATAAAADAADAAERKAQQADLLRIFGD